MAGLRVWLESLFPLQLVLWSWLRVAFEHVVILCRLAGLRVLPESLLALWFFDADWLGYCLLRTTSRLIRPSRYTNTLPRRPKPSPTRPTRPTRPTQQRRPTANYFASRRALLHQQAQPTANRPAHRRALPHQQALSTANRPAHRRALLRSSTIARYC